MASPSPSPGGATPGVVAPSSQPAAVLPKPQPQGNPAFRAMGLLYFHLTLFFVFSLCLQFGQ